MQLKPSTASFVPSSFITDPILSAESVKRAERLQGVGLEIRDLTVRDFPAVMAAYFDQWGRDDDGLPVVSGYWTAKLFEKAAFGRLIWKNGELWGLAIGHARGMKPLDLGSDWKTAREWAKEVEAELGADGLALNDEIDVANKALMDAARASGRDFRAELDFLWVSRKARGLGLSRVLLEEVHAVMRSLGAREYSLFTDNYCDVSFYLRAPWEKVGERPWAAAKDWRLPDSRSFMFARKIA